MRLCLLGALFAAVALGLYSPALSGSFVSDDLHYVQNNPYVQDPGLEEMIAILDPRSAVPLLVENYAPVHLLLHALEWKLFGSEVMGYHVVNVVLHALAAVLLIPLFARSGIPLRWAIVGGALFLAHPANVEAVAWISQLKSPAALGLALGALLAHPRRPLLAAVLFGLALFAKPLVAFALPVALLLGVSSRPGESQEGRRFALDPAWRWGWLCVWAGVLGLFAIVEVQAFSRTAGNAVDLYPELDTKIRSTLAIAGRYLWMAASGTGLSTFHEPRPSGSLDPVWLASALCILLLGFRTATCIWSRRAEGAYLAWALLAYLPVCGLLVPLTYPMADRYLYFILPGLVGATLLGAPAAAKRLLRSLGRTSFPAGLEKLVGAGALALLAWFAFASFDRAAVWRTPERVFADSVVNYPDGSAATLGRAGRAAQSGDTAEALRQLRLAQGRGYARVDQLLANPAFATIRHDPGFRAILSEMATNQLKRLEQSDSPSQLELHSMALMYNTRGETGRAIAALEQALAVGGPIDDQVKADLDDLRRQARFGRPRP